MHENRAVPRHVDALRRTATPAVLRTTDATGAIATQAERRQAAHEAAGSHKRSE
ncbi:hypothetical protein [Planotetraspora mira]|uniref:hypothetical protein n=1 Tax=Planotetraspora mira TaxID=58121 RepID=UPI0019510DFA|nr:hypothetical protein [Planotetraspora mira]